MSANQCGPGCRKYVEGRFTPSRSGTCSDAGRVYRFDKCHTGLFDPISTKPLYHAPKFSHPPIRIDEPAQRQPLCKDRFVAVPEDGFQGHE